MNAALKIDRAFRKRANAFDTQFYVLSRIGHLMHSSIISMVIH